MNFSDQFGQFRDTGLYNVGGAVSYPAPNTGIHKHTGKLGDIGKFTAERGAHRSLHARSQYSNVIGCDRTLVAGGRTILSGPNTGVGSRNPNKDPLMHPFFPMPQNKKGLIAFLESLTDDELMHDPRFSDPWPE